MAKKNEIKFAIDYKKLERDIQKQTKVEAKQAFDSLKKNDLQDIGDGIVDQMKILIAKGISPIKGFGRFPAYKWASKKSLARKSGSARGKKLNRQFQNKYPYSARKDFPDKRERPVNLKLSGQFLENLIARVKGKTIEIGFFEKPWTEYEQGHREGVNGQPPRPIIPENGEEFGETIYRRLVKTLQSVFDKKNRT